VILLVVVALAIGLGASLTFAALQGPEPTSVPAIVLESGSPPGSENQPSHGGNQGQKKEKVNRQSGDSPGMGGSTGSTAESGAKSGGARPAPPPPPAPAGDDDEREDGGEDGGDDGGDG
jgi:hypothetical protein